ncbi:MAG: HNH endonuclease [Muribaculaceae bacterium]|nr:HNH endonuclease [Muribaculaceae bacterium]
MNTFLLQRPVDLSLLTNGFHIPVFFHTLVYSMCGEIRHGDSLSVEILIGDETFSAKLYNINFDQKRYSGHPDLFQIRYTPTSRFAKRLQAIFRNEYDFLLNERTIVGPRKQIHLPKEYNSNVIFYGTHVNGTFVLECNPNCNFEEIKKSFQNITEEEFEIFTPIEDKTTSIKELSHIQRIRHLDRSIGDTLKKLYGYRYQMTGEQIGENYGITSVEAHHIIPFTESLDNETSNIIILSPSYHRIIHQAKPLFNRKQLAYEFPNGLIEKVRLDKHLNIKDASQRSH